MALFALFFAAGMAAEPEAPSPPKESVADSPPVVEVDPIAARWPQRFEGQVQPDNPYFDLEVMYTEARFDDGLREVERRLRSTPDDVDLLWMKVRFLYEIGERFTAETEVDRVAYYKEMVAITERGLELDPDNVHHRFGRGVAMGRLGTSRGVLASLFMAKQIEADWLAVAEHPTFRYATLEGNEMLPCDVFHGLGIYYRLLPDWWIIQVLAGTRGSLERSAEFHRKAIACKPGWIQNWKELAATQYCMATKNKDEAMRERADETAQHGLSLPVNTDKNRIDHRHLQQLRDDPKLGCGYSRDGQQELNEKKLARD